MAGFDDGRWWAILGVAGVAGVAGIAAASRGGARAVRLTTPGLSRTPSPDLFPSFALSDWTLVPPSNRRKGNRRFGWWEWPFPSRIAQWKDGVLPQPLLWMIEHDPPNGFLLNFRARRGWTTWGPGLDGSGGPGGGPWSTPRAAAAAAEAHTKSLFERGVLYILNGGSKAIRLSSSKTSRSLPDPTFGFCTFCGKRPSTWGARVPEGFEFVRSKDPEDGPGEWLFKGQPVFCSSCQAQIDEEERQYDEAFPMGPMDPDEEGPTAEEWEAWEKKLSEGSSAIRLSDPGLTRLPPPPPDLADELYAKLLSVRGRARARLLDEDDIRRALEQHERILRIANTDDTRATTVLRGGFVVNSYGSKADSDEVRIESVRTRPAGGWRTTASAKRGWAQSRSYGHGDLCVSRLARAGQSDGRIVS